MKMKTYYGQALKQKKKKFWRMFWSKTNQVLQVLNILMTIYHSIGDVA